MDESSAPHHTPQWMHTIFSFAFIAVYCALVWRWSSDLRDKVGPWLESRSTRRAGSSKSDREAAGAVARIVLLFAATFLPTLGLGLAAHFHALSWQRANSMLIFSLLLPGFSFVLGARHKRERS